jgi:hypothetical protein
LLDLGLSLTAVELVDADSVDEEQPVFTLRRGSVQEVEEIAADEELLAIDANLSDVIY